MKEAVLYYLWQQQAFNRNALQTTDGQPLAIQSVGILNTNAGPDFAMARLYIDNLEWYGSVEMHITASEWRRHRHHQDPAYERVILHVVWEYDQDVYRSDGTQVPTLELKSRVDSPALFRIRSLLDREHSSIPCAHLVHQLPEIIKIAQIERAALQRMERKASEVLKLLKHKKGDWQETAYHCLLRSFGFKTNQNGMELLAQALPLRWVRKWQSNPDQLTNILLSQAGLSRYLESEALLPISSELKKKQLNPSVWRYSRVRPANFPHNRIKQLATCLAQWQADLNWLLTIHPLEYYVQQFQAEAIPGVTNLSTGSINTIIINTVVPLLTAHGIFHRNNAYQQHAWSCLGKIGAEDNKITRKYTKLSFPNSSAVDTQGTLELNQKYCTKKRCLSCSIGAAILKKQPMFVS